MMMTKDISPWSIFRPQIGKRGKALEILLNLFDEFYRNWRYLGARPSVRVSFPHHSLDQFLPFVFYPIDWITSPLHWPTILWVSQYNNESEQSRRQIVSPFLFVFFFVFHQQSREMTFASTFASMGLAHHWPPTQHPTIDPTASLLPPSSVAHHVIIEMKTRDSCVNVIHSSNSLSPIFNPIFIVIFVQRRRRHWLSNKKSKLQTYVKWGT